ncbi:MAG: hypothetical protein JKY96_05800 [Phycisphaerales bacterium]|nr:hypothetical protein [Phycisphaerales bacterium]
MNNAKMIGVSLAATMTLMGSSAFAGGAMGGSFEMVSYTIDGGGIVGATGGSFSLSGTIGQPDAGSTMVGGSFELTGGFWATVPSVVCAADLAEPLGVLNLQDIFAYLALFNSSDPAADLASPFGTLNLQDIFAYLALFNAGCP